MITTSTNRRSSATDQLLGLLQDNRLGKEVGIYSICSANRFVLEASMDQAGKDDSLLLIESTSNQVNQFGGYTGQTPVQFAHSVYALADSMGFPKERLLLGGDHLGPHVWRKESSRQAMEKACTLVKESVLAGYTKIHLDASMHCADDPGSAKHALPDEIVSERAAQMCEAAEAAHGSLPDGSPKPVYVIGTEVPIPGGELNEAAPPKITSTECIQTTIEIAKRAFAKRRLESAWERVIAIVVQPGVEFGDATVFPYDSSRNQPLAQFAVNHWQGVYEAHSTDYQTASALQQMVKDHFGILKVGPWLTFAFREAVFALAAIEEASLANHAGITLSHVREELERAMLANPAYWKDYYHGDENALRHARQFSYSDRARYYWPQPNVARALECLIANLTSHPPSIESLNQFLPRQAALLRHGQPLTTPNAIIRGKISEVLNIYSSACGARRQETPGC